MGGGGWRLHHGSGLVAGWPTWHHMLGLGYSPGHCHGGAVFAFFFCPFLEGAVLAVDSKSPLRGCTSQIKLAEGRVAGTLWASQTLGGGSLCTGLFF